MGNLLALVGLASLKAIDRETGRLNVIIETPKGSRNKYDYDPEVGLFKLHKVLPLGTVFPYDFGFVPATIEQDGDPLDVLLLTQEPTFTGCWVTARPIGVIEAEQKEKGKTLRNDRLLAVAETNHHRPTILSIRDLGPERLHEIEHFFISFNEMEGREFKPIGRHGPKRAEKLIEEGIRHFERTEG